MSPPSLSSPRPLPARSALLIVLAALAPGALAQDAESEDTLRGFSLHDTEGARATQREAEEHLAAGRTPEALACLQELLDAHEGEVLGPTRPTLPGAATEKRSQQDVFAGAAAWTTERLFELDAAARDTYRRRFEERAADALEAAVADVDRRRLAHVARRWPLTDASQRAWIALGDIEIERGNVDAARAAWGRALAFALRRDPFARHADGWEVGVDEIAARGDSALADALRARFALQGSVATASTPEHDPAEGASALAQSDVAHVPPSSRAEGWPTSVSLPSHPFRANADFVLYPARWQDKILVSTSLEMIAYRASSGEVEWRSGEPAEWLTVPNGERDILQGKSVESRECFVAPAVGSGVAVATLQIPYSFEDPFLFGEMEIIKVIPNRRLFAFDATTGEPLWDTRPPPGWNGETGSFSDRMRIVGPPVIAGSRVLAPAARLRGRIEYHVGCFDLFTGELLWSTPVVTGQRELNMFGRITHEFCAPPLVVHGDRVIALTQLGTVAALDLFTGDILWEVLYDAIKIQRVNQIESRPLANLWRNAPPVVAGPTVIAAPFDGKDLIAVDLDSGAMLWTQSFRTVQKVGLSAGSGKTGVLNLLVGADEERVYFSGTRLVALGARTGSPARVAVDEVRWMFPAGMDRASDLDHTGPRAVIDADRVYYPGTSLFAVDRENGQLREKMDWLPGKTRGNLLFCDGMLFSLSQQALTGYFEWERMIEEARRRVRQSPGDAEAAIDLALLLHSHAEADRTRDEMARAVRSLDEVREVLAPVVANDSRARDVLHEALRTQARALRDLARPAEAIAALERARELAPTRAAECDTLLEQLAIARERDPQRWDALLAALLERCADLPLDVELSPRETLLGERLTPIVGSAASESPRTVQLPVGAWALLRRIERASGAPPTTQEFEDLHRLLSEYPSASFGVTTAGSWARARIDSRLEAGGAEAYAPFEARAQELYEAALAAGDGAELARVSTLYPHSKAAGLANEARLTAALEQRDVGTIAAITIGELPPRWSPRSASERELRHLLKLAHACGEVGNERLRSSLYAALSRDHGTLRSDVGAHGGATLAELSAAHPVTAPAMAPPASFDHLARQCASIRGRYEPLGAIPPASEDGEWLLAFAGETSVQAFAISSPCAPAWSFPVPRSERPTRWSSGRVLALPGRLVLATRERVLALDATSGEPAWEIDSRGAAMGDLAEADGVLAVPFFARGAWSENPSLDAVVVGIEWAAGHELWRLPIAEDLAGGRITCGEGRLVVLPPRTSRRLELRDLFTASLIATTETDALAEPTLPAAFVAGGKLVLPRFLVGIYPDRNKITALDLDRATEAWSIDIGGGQRDGADLTTVLTRGGAVYLELRSQSGGSRPGTRAIYELSPRIGAVSSAPIATYAETDKLLGAGLGNKRVEIASPTLFVLSDGSRPGRCVLRAIQLPYGQRWETELSYQRDDYTESMTPALSETTVALSFRVGRTEDSQRRFVTDLVLLDRASGALRDRRTLMPELDQDDVDLVAFGDALYVCGSGSMEILR